MCIAAGSCGLFFSLLCLALPCAADTIIETGAGIEGPSVNASQFESQGWNQTESYDNVSISVALLSWTPGATFDITAYLTNAIGPSAPLLPLESMSLSGATADSDPQTFLLFTGLTLGPGTYFLTLSSTDNTGGQPGALWPTECISGCPVALDSGVSLLSEDFVNQSFGLEDSAFPPDSTFMTSAQVLNLTVTNDVPASLPEPATFSAALVGMAGLALGMGFRRRRGRSRSS
jgi:hypothetical protein